MAEEKKKGVDVHNISVNEEENSVVISVNPRLYKAHFIMRAADDIHEEFGYKQMDVIVDGDPYTEILVKFIPREKKRREELLKLAYHFTTQLLTSVTKR